MWCSWENYIKHNVTLTEEDKRKLPSAKRQQQSLLSYEAHEIDHSGPIENEREPKRQKVSDDGAGVLPGGARAKRLRRGSGDEEKEEEEEEQEEEEDEDTMWDQLCRDGPNFETSAKMREAMPLMPQGSEVAILYMQGEEWTAGILTKLTKAAGRSNN